MERTSIMSNLDRRSESGIVLKGWRLIALCGGVAALGVAGYLLASGLTSSLGFPLDDAWIHQAYARNLGQRGEFAFLPGRPSAGSTSPLWAVLIAIGYAAGVEPLLWTYFLGWLVLSGMAYIGYWGVRILAPSRAAWAPWGAVLLGLEWHLVWAAGSGMETLLAALLVTGILLLQAKPNLNGWIIGILIGVGAWVRPDLITLLGPVGLTIFLNGPTWLVRVRDGLKTLLGFGALFVPYLVFNRILAGTLWPNTFYAKQAEYAVLQQVPLLSRYLAQLQLPLVGVGIALLPGLTYFLVKAWQGRWWGALSAVVWGLLYLAVFALRLPVTYQHGRYVMPAMPVFFLWGGAGLFLWMRQGEPVAWRRVVGRTWLAVTGIILVSFWGLGGRGYANDVGFIETEMVATAHWVAIDTPQDALLAAHDIGALGYFGGRDLLDMAGLVSPEVIGFIRDEDRLRDYLTEKGVRYLVTFPSWYPDLVRGGVPVYRTGGTFGPQLGSDNMAVYSWPIEAP
jgi:hypothetical protein